jgi:hypothetical protein
MRHFLFIQSLVKVLNEQASKEYTNYIHTNFENFQE